MFENINFDEIKTTELTEAVSKPKTLEELFVDKYTELEKSHAKLAIAWIQEQQKTKNLQNIIDTLKAHAKFDGEYITIMVGGFDEIKDRNFLVKELGLTKEENE